MSLECNYRRNPYLVSLRMGDWLLRRPVRGLTCQTFLGAFFALSARAVIRAGDK